MEKKLTGNEPTLARQLEELLGGNYLVDSEKKAALVERISELEKAIDDQEVEIMDRNYLIAAMSGEGDFETREGLKEKCVEEGLKIRDRIQELEKDVAKHNELNEALKAMNHLYKERMSRLENLCKSTCELLTDIKKLIE